MQACGLKQNKQLEDRPSSSGSTSAKVLEPNVDVDNGNADDDAVQQSKPGATIGPIATSSTPVTVQQQTPKEPGYSHTDAMEVTQPLSPLQQSSSKRKYGHIYVHYQYCIAESDLSSTLP